MIKALGKRLVVKEIIPVKEEKKSLLILPEKREQMLAKVMAVGDEVDSYIQLHDTVYLLNDTGVPVEINGEIYLSIMENQVLAAWKDD